MVISVYRTVYYTEVYYSQEQVYHQTAQCCNGFSGIYPICNRKLCMHCLIISMQWYNYNNYIIQLVLKIHQNF